MPTTDLPPRERDYLARLTQRIHGIEQDIDKRAETMARLHEQGYTYEALGEACKMTKSAAHRTVKRWLERERRNGRTTTHV